MIGEKRTRKQPSDEIEKLKIGQVLGRYKILDILGQGGNGVVYLAKDMSLEKKWAIKQICKDIKREEALIMRDLDHPGIPRITEQIEDETYFYIVMDFCKGESLWQYCRKRNVSADEIIIWGVQLCDILIYLHRQNPPVIFRDVKPGNIMRGEDGRLKLIDFGIAKTGLLVGDENGESENRKEAKGTKGFAAPEQYEGRYSVQSDVYNLGASLLWCMNGIGCRDLRRVLRKAISEKTIWRYKNCEQLRRKLLKLQKKRRKERIRIRIWIVMIGVMLSVLIAGTITEWSILSQKRSLLLKETVWEIEMAMQQDYEMERQKYKEGLEQKKKCLQSILQEISKEEKVV